MCGITGLINISTSEKYDIVNLINKMTLKLEHRGPDDSGIWSDQLYKIALGHRRLSIIDVSSAGHQPMESISKNYVLSFNGEIYNHLEIRKKLILENSSIKWVGSSDTETLLVAIEYWGIDKTILLLNGMFAFALWDKNSETLYLAKDRLGEKPLYYGWTGYQKNLNIYDLFFFSSELKAVKSLNQFNNKISIKALNEYIKFAYVPSPLSIYNHIYKLEPGCLLKINGFPPKIPPLKAIKPNESYLNVKINKYYSLKKEIFSNKQNIIHSEKEAVHKLESSLTESIKLQSLADVPIGAFLSGGIDSSLIVALMQQNSSSKIKTYTVGFDEKDFDESKYAESISNHLGTDHSTLIVDSFQTKNLIYKLHEIYDEPFADSSQIPTYLISQFAKKNVSVALTGDGSDELFGGYNRYLLGPKVWNKLKYIPKTLRHSLGTTLSSIPISYWDLLNKKLTNSFTSYKGINQLGSKAYKLSNRLTNINNSDDLYKSLVYTCLDPINILNIDYKSEKNLADNIDNLFHDCNHLDLNNSAERMMYCDFNSYLSDDILCKVDRAAMATSLETRVPFLDYRIVNLSTQIPLNMKIRNGESKWIVRQLLYKHVPKYLVDRPKAGFGVPVGQWLRGPLRPWAENLLNQKRIISDGFFDPSIINKIWNEHINLISDNTTILWTVLMFQAWYDNQQENLD